MRRLLYSAFVAAAMLTGCTTTGSGTLDPTKVQDIIAQVKAYAVQTCAFLPDATNLALLVNAFYAPSIPYTTLVTSVGNAVCQAATTTTASRTGKITKMVKSRVGIVKVTGKRVSR